MLSKFRVQNYEYFMYIFRLLYDGLKDSVMIIKNQILFLKKDEMGKLVLKTYIIRFCIKTYYVIVRVLIMKIKAHKIHWLNFMYFYACIIMK